MRWFKGLRLRPIYILMIVVVVVSLHFILFTKTTHVSEVIEQITSPHITTHHITSKTLRVYHAKAIENNIGITTYPDSTITVVPGSSGKDLTIKVSTFGLGNAFTLDITQRLSGLARARISIGYRLLWYKRWSLGAGLTYDFAYLKVRRNIFPKILTDTGIFVGYGIPFSSSTNLSPVCIGVDIRL